MKQKLLLELTEVVHIESHLEGIQVHMLKVGEEPSAIDEYLSNPEVSMGEASFTLEDIFKEKYVAMFLHPEAWIDAKRFDYGYENFTLLLT